MRLFVAIDIPDAIRTALAEFTEKAKLIQRQGLKYVENGNWHTTLKFIGETPPERLDEITKALSEIAFEPFQLECRGTGSFPARGNPRVIWSGIDTSEPLVRLADAVDRRLFASGFPRDTKKFSPHLTIAGVKSEISPALRDYLDKSTDRFFGGFTVDSFAIYKSDLTQKGPVYTIIEKFSAMKSPASRS
jgi:2'-5' RNA ligase